MQRGVIYKDHGSWLLRYYDWVLVEGRPVRRRCCKKLAPIDKQHRSKASVMTLADEILRPINSGQLQPESTMLVEEFITQHYMPHVQKTLRPATYKNYNDIFRFHVQGKLKVRLRDFRTVTAQRFLNDVDGVGHTTKLRIKSFLSGIFKHAKQIGVLDGINPVQDAVVMGNPERKKMPVYDLAEIEEMLRVLPEPAKTVIAVASLTGLRVSELMGLRWSDYNGETLHVSRSVWRTHIRPPKTAESEAEIPVLPVLKAVLRQHRTRTGASDEDYIFAGTRRNVPLNLNNLVRRVIMPAINGKEICKGQMLQWKGWHAFRRGAATMLHSLGVQPRIIQGLLRHADIRTTMNIYTQVVTEDSKAAMERLEQTLFPFGA